jgi:hypothetical protein
MSGKSQVQSVLVPRSRYTLAQAKAWVKDHGYIVNYPGKTGPHTTADYYRFRQHPPSSSAKYVTIRTENTGGILFVVKA